MSTTVEIRKLLSDEKKQILSAIWAYRMQNHEWTPVREIHKQFGGPITVRALVKELGGSIIFTPEQHDVQRYILTTLGVLVSDQGEKYERLLANYLTFANEKCYEEPSRAKINSQEVAEGLHLKSDEVTALGYLIQNDSRFTGGSGSFSPEIWELGIPANIEDIPLDSLTYVQQLVGADYDPQMPIEALNRHSYLLSATLRGKSEAVRKELELVREQLLNEVFVFFQHSDPERGQEAFTRWKERVAKYLQHNIPEEVQRFEQATTSRPILAIRSGEHPFELFRRTVGKTALAYIEELLASIRQGRINLDTQETPRSLPAQSQPYVDPDRIQELQNISSQKFDLTKLIKLCQELNQCSADNCYFAVAMLVRAILDHVPPIFGLTAFKEVASNYTGAKSFKGSMQNLENSARKIADRYLHGPIRSKETLPTGTQINFSNDLDVLLEEIVRILK